MTSIVDRLLGRQPQPGQAHDGCCGHGERGQHAVHGGTKQHATDGCCGGSHHNDHTEKGAVAADEAPVETAGSRA